MYLFPPQSTLTNKLNLINDTCVNKRILWKGNKTASKFLHLSHTWEKWKYNGAVHQLLLTTVVVDADEVDLLSVNVHTTNKNAEAILLFTSKDAGLKVNTEKIKYKVCPLNRMQDKSIT